MAKGKTQKQEKVNIAINCEAQKYYSYADYFNKHPLFISLQIYNGGTENIENITVTVSSDSSLILPASKDIALLPYESAVEVDIKNVASPVFLTTLNEECECDITIRVQRDDSVLAETLVKAVVLPFDYWSGTEDDMAELACYIRPKLTDCTTVLAGVSRQLEKWKNSFELDGYEGTDRNNILQMIAALFSVIRKDNYEQVASQSWKTPFKLNKISDAVKQKRATRLDMAIFACSCIEAAGMHPVLAVGDGEMAVGVWLYDNCFMDGVSDDLSVLDKYTLDGVNNISCFDVADAFTGANANFSLSAKHFRDKLAADMYDYVVDVKRCRIGGFRALPLKASGATGDEFLLDEEMDLNVKPKQLAAARKVSGEVKLSKNKQWERKLLDLSLKNSLLNFNCDKLALKIVSCDSAVTHQCLISSGDFSFLPPPSEVNVVGCESIGVQLVSTQPLKELVEIELKNKKIHVVADSVRIDEVLSTLARKGKTIEEESGARLVYVALGFLKWICNADGKEKYAPLMLLPAKITRGRGGKYTAKFFAEEFQVNTTLLEYLKQEFNIDMRGLDSLTEKINVDEVLSIVRRAVVDYKGWTVYSDVYISAFMFARYAMWKDIRANIGKYKKNPLVASLINNRLELTDVHETDVEEDSVLPEKIITPLSADATQFSALLQADSCGSFVLHGPPGTGKSQTITNLIANALLRGKRVLFVAEKQAALDVVKKRLNAIGIGEFCAELHSGKSDKNEFLQSLANAFALKIDFDENKFFELSERLTRIRGEVNEPIKALHKRRGLGVSVYEAILEYLKNKSAPDLIDIESSFYDTLTKGKLERYEEMLLMVASAAKECGGAYRSPFDNVNVTEYSQELKDKLYCTSEVILREIKNCKNFIELFLEFYQQRITNFTPKKLSLLSKLVNILRDDRLQIYFNQEESEFDAFFNANRRLDRQLEIYNARFRRLAEITKEYPQFEAEMEGCGGNIEGSKLLMTVVKRLNRCTSEPLTENEIPRYINNIVAIYKEVYIIKENTNLYKQFFDKNTLNFRKRTEFLSVLYDINDIGEKLFLDYNADSFNGMCIRSSNGFLEPMLESLASAIEHMKISIGCFTGAMEAEESKYADEDIFEYFTQKATALIDNIDMLPAWCMYKSTARDLNDAGLNFITYALESGKISNENILSCFRKNVYKNYFEASVTVDPVLSRFSTTVFEDRIELFKKLCEDFAAETRSYLRASLINSIPSDETQSSVSVEISAFKRMIKTNLRGTTLRTLFESIPNLMASLAPCLLMSPFTVAQYLPAQTDLFDLVIFDEASQLPTSEAIGSLARAKNAIIVGDGNQLPPTSFFNSAYVDEDNIDNEDMESVLDDCLALGMPEKHLLWHYRSRHESLIAFSNIMYYGNKLYTFPSPDALESRVKLRFVEDGAYDRGLSKNNKKEADALVEEVIRRLSDVKLRNQSIGIVTFSSAQQVLIERKLNDALYKNKLDEVAFDRDEPLFVKNLENVQGDERDVILFSVCYGPDKRGKLSLNFGPLNQTGGWRRLNVAASRARESMLIFSSMKSSAIDLSKTRSRGVAGLKAFLEFAEKGRTTLAINADNVKRESSSIGEYIAKDLSSYGYECRYNVGVSEFKIDCAVVDPKNKKRFILAIVCDNNNVKSNSARDRNLIQINTLKLGNWNVIRLFTISYINNPKREIKRIKDVLDRLTGSAKAIKDNLAKYRKTYKLAPLCAVEGATSQYITSGENDADIIARLKAIVAAEEPISKEYLFKRLILSLGIYKYGTKAEELVSSLIMACNFKSETVAGVTYYRKTDKCINYSFYRIDGDVEYRRMDDEYTVYEIITLIKGLIENRVSVYLDELIPLICAELDVKQTSAFADFVVKCINVAQDEGVFIRSLSDKISLV